MLDAVPAGRFSDLWLYPCTGHVSGPRCSQGSEAIGGIWGQGQACYLEEKSWFPSESCGKWSIRPEASLTCSGSHEEKPGARVAFVSAELA